MNAQPVRYRWVVEGTAADGQTWRTAGVVDRLPGHFPHVTMDALTTSFALVTEGRAEFGRPGETCRGPYTITRLEVVREFGIPQ